MNTDKFNEVLNSRLDKIKTVLAKKAGEYVKADDRLYNFRRASKVFGVTDIEALSGMMAKHLVSILDIIDDAKVGKYPSIALRDEKIGDMINYLILLEAMLIDNTAST